MKVGYRVFDEVLAADDASSELCRPTVVVRTRYMSFVTSQVVMGNRS